MTGPLDPEAMRRSVENLTFGAVVSSSASVTGVESVRFLADEERALFQMFAMAEEAARKWDANVSIAQRLGELMPGDTALVIVVACGDRNAAHECCRFLSDRMAGDVPVWTQRIAE